MGPLFTQILAMQDIIRGSEPVQPQPTWCRWCREDGSCMHCEGDSARHTGPSRGSMAEFDRKMAAYRAKCAAQKMEDE
jgi:hypothetical protein